MRNGELNTSSNSHYNKLDNDKGVLKMKKATFNDLMEKNKEEILQDKEKLEKIEKRIDLKYSAKK